MSSLQIRYAKRGCTDIYTKCAGIYFGELCYSVSLTKHVSREPDSKHRPMDYNITLYSLLLHQLSNLDMFLKLLSNPL